MFLESSSHLQASLIRFVHGPSLAELLVLRGRLSKLMFTLTIERKTDGKHSSVKRLIGHRGRAGGSFVPFRLRVGELEACLDNDGVGPLQCVADHVERSGRVLGKRLGWGGRPD
eukprot:7704373-Alexandrium_andersonii.AAC.1